MFRQNVAMKNLHPRKRTLLCFFALAGSLAWAQMPSVTPNAGLNAGFIKLFGNATAFTAKVDAQVLDKEKVEWVRMPMDFAALDGKVRVAVNMEQIKSKNLPPSVTASFKQAGMDRVLSII